MSRITVLADDTTGALEMGAHLAGAGLRTRVLTGGAAAPPFPEIAVLDLQTRGMTASEAEAATERAARRCGEHIYLKTDSTLRGNIAAELHALARVFPSRPLVYVPAYPATGRTVACGVLYVHGRRLDETEFGGDAVIRRLLGNLPVEVIDGAVEADLFAAAESLRGRNAVVAGTGGFAPHWLRVLGFAALTAPPRLRVCPGPCLVVNGSAHPISHGQTAAVCGDDRFIILNAPAERRGDPRDVLKALSRRATAAIQRSRPAALIVFGGDTVFAILSAMGILEVDPLGELLPGVPVSRLAPIDLPLISKAGGFGGRDLLPRIADRLKELE